MVCIQNRTYVLLVLDWVQTICKCYQLTMKEWGTQGIMNTKAADVKSSQVKSKLFYFSGTHCIQLEIQHILYI